MSGRVQFVAALMCDDIRYEADGGYSLMGVTGPDLGVASFPTRKPMSFGLIVNVLEPGEATFTAQLLWKGERRWAVESATKLLEAGSGILYPHDGTIANFDSPGELLLQIEYEGGTIDLQKWNVHAVAIDENDALD